jgi:hypothetical protein
MIFRLLGTWPSQSDTSPTTRLHSPISAVEGYPYRVISISYELWDDFHGGNTGSKSVGDAKLKLR